MLPAMHVRRRAAARRHRVVRSLLLLLVVGLVGAVAGCGTFARDYPPTGVDQLAIPTPSPDPSDFVRGVDNPWLPLPPGRVQTFRVSRLGEPDAVRTVTVLPDRVTVAGVAATAVRSELDGVTATDLYAQDRQGNVWWLGHDEPDEAASWRAGERGGEAGLAMAAGPRVGDGYRLGLAPGVYEGLARVVEREGDEIVVEVSDRLDRGSVGRETYRRGTGLVDRIDSAGLAEELVGG